MRKKKWMIWLCVIAVSFTASGIAYNRLSTTYEQKGAESIVYDQNDDIEKKSMQAVDTTEKKKADDFIVYDQNKNKVRLLNYIGKPLIVNFWASWCPPCKREMPAFQNAIDLYGEDINFLMINETDGERETMDTAQTFLNDNGYNMNVLFDMDGDAGNTYNVLFLPRTLFIDEDGTIVEDHVGELSETELTDTIKELLEVNSTY